MHASAGDQGGFALRFEHPVLAGALVGGWMNRVEDQPALPAPEVISVDQPIHHQRMPSHCALREITQHHRLGKTLCCIDSQ